MTRSGPNGLASAPKTPVTQEAGCYSAGVDAPAQSNASRCRTLSGRRSGKIPWPVRPRRDWVEESQRFRLPAAPLHGGQLLVEDSLLGNRPRQPMKAAPKQARTSGLSAPLL